MKDCYRGENFTLFKYLLYRRLEDVGPDRGWVFCKKI